MCRREQANESDGFEQGTDRVEWVPDQAQSDEVGDSFFDSSERGFVEC